MSAREYPFFDQYKRLPTREVKAGNLGIGGDNPIRIQSMTNTLPSEIKESVKQIKALAEAGCELVRLAVPSVKEAESLSPLKDALIRENISVPLCADIHFQPKAAEIAARYIEKIRINPGNYFENKKLPPDGLSPDQEQKQLTALKEKLRPLIKICRENQTAVRIGVNYGSLSPRMISRFGNGAEGMAESALEFVRIFAEEDFHELVISLKASHTRVMIHACRLMTARMLARHDRLYPLHLGVTEAGSGREGRLKSVLGCAALLADGLGDTLRISLTEDPVREIKPAAELAAYFNCFQPDKADVCRHKLPSPYNYHPFKPDFPHDLAGFQKPLVISSAVDCPESLSPDLILKAKDAATADCFYFDQENSTISEIRPAEFREGDLYFPLIRSLEKARAYIPEKGAVPLIAAGNHSGMHLVREIILELRARELRFPLMLLLPDFPKADKLITATGSYLSLLLTDSLIDGLMTTDPDPAFTVLLFQALQATGERLSSAEYITCPTCGRTAFNIEKIAAEVKKQTARLRGVKIGIMGCVVNGPGEMADSDVGLVGSGRGKVHLYLGKQVYRKNIPEEQGTAELIKLLKKEGYWKN